MPSTFLGLNTSYRGLVAANGGLNTTSNNISNIETKGYSRQKIRQTAANPIRTYCSYGCVGTGVETLAAERQRDEFYDKKYWNNNSKLGEYNKKQYYASIAENYLQDTKGSNAVIGFTTLFDEYSAALDSLSTHTGDSNYALTYIGKAGNLCEYFQLLYNNFQKIQTDINDEIKIKVDQINGIAQQIGSLNKEINVIESDGVSIANELRDKRDLMVDELSALVDVEVSETRVENTGVGGGSVMTDYMVKIAGGQILVDGYDYRQLECVPREYYSAVNQNDVDGLYDIVWQDSREELPVYANSTRGELRGLFEMRDGNNNEAFHGKVSSVDPGKQTVTIEVTEDYLKDMAKCTLPFTNGKINVGGTDYVYDSWSYTENEDGCFYTFQLNTSDPLVNPEKIGTDKSSQLASVGEQVDYQGVAYYLEQMNEWVRDYASAYNKIYGQEGATDYYEKDDRQGAIFFTGMNGVSGEQFQLKVSLDKPAGDTEWEFSSADDGYFKLTAGNVEIIDEVVKNPNLMVTHTGTTTGVSNYNLLQQLKDLSVNTDLMEFRGCQAKDFLVCLMGDAALNASSANNFQNVYSNIAGTIENNRYSISGVDADEEAANLMTYQTAYNLSSKMISVLSEVYDRLILETGV